MLLNIKTTGFNNIVAA